MDLKPYRYHPIRWDFLRPSDEYADFCEAYWENDLHDEEIAAAGGKERLEAIMESEEMTWSHIQDFEKAGRHIYHLDAGLVHMFRQTSVGDVPIDLLTSPYDSIFIYFGHNGGIRHPADGRTMDGAYVRITEDTGGDSQNSLVWICLCPDFPELKSALDLPLPARLRSDNGYRTIFLPSELGTVGNAHEHLFKPYAKKISEFEHYRGQKIMKEIGLIRETETYEKATGRDWIDPEDELWLGHDKEAVNLVINALAFLTSRPDNPSLGFPKDAPADLVAKASDSALSKQSRRAQNKLESLGYRRVYTCRHQSTASFEAVKTHEVGMHWRKGHWRNQAHGPGRNNRKLIWIEPVLVNVSDEPLPGRVHMTKPTR